MAETVGVIADYIRWRGDIPFDKMPVNEVDMYLLAKIGSPDLKDYVPGEGEGITLKDAYEPYFSRTDIDPTYLGKLIPSQQVKNLRELAQTPRYQNLILSDYVQTYNESRTEQFSALTVSLPDGPTVITFRGTDDTIIGWKENFSFAMHRTVAAQRDAAQYLSQEAQKHAGPLLILGHSKGGNLAVFAAVTANKETRDRIVQVANFDGPGFHGDFWLSPAATEMQDRIVNYLSQHSMVGTLMQQGGRTEICRSTRTGPLAHEAMFWEVIGPRFIRAEKREPGSIEFGNLINTQAEQMNDEEIAKVVEDFFGVLTSGGATTLTQLTRQGFTQKALMLKDLAETDSIRGLLGQLADILFLGDSALNLSLRKPKETDGYAKYHKENNASDTDGNS